MTTSLTIVITSYNEARTLARTYEHARYALEGLTDWELILIDDCSQDESAAIARELAQKNPHTRAICNAHNRNQGGCYAQSIGLATKTFHCLLPGDDMVEPDSLRALFRSTGQADMSLIAVENPQVRHPARRALSMAFVQSLQAISRTRLSYYNGPVIIRTELLHGVSLSGSSAFVPESTVPLLRLGHSYVVVPVRFRPDHKGANLQTVRRNALPVIRTLWRLWSGKGDILLFQNPQRRVRQESQKK